MSGRSELFIYPVLALSLVAAVTDIVWGRIFNWLTIPALLIGIFMSAWSGGWLEARDALWGVLLGLLLFGWMFLIGILGGGDVKLLMALGAWGGLAYAEDVAVLTMILGGAMALLTMIFKRRFGSFAKRMYEFILSLTVSELEPAFPEVDRKLTMPFGVPIAVAAAWVALSNPLPAWGIHLWP